MLLPLQSSSLAVSARSTTSAIARRWLSRLCLKKDIRIVDDEADVPEVLTAMLETAGYAVDTAGTVAEARELLGEFRYGWR
jgi:PleD family two-component response regulator